MPLILGRLTVMNANQVMTEFLQNPIPFCGGFLAGILRLDLTQEPFKSWLEEQGIQSSPTSSGAAGPQSIAID
ncbi:MAG: hypothetical protein NW237_03030 [Cyanobacteriota bacterium]|nr:hypothetical protein [Cyanobacteriota bacterium]